MSEQTQKCSATQVILGKLREAISKLQALPKGKLPQNSKEILDENFSHIDILCEVLAQSQIPEDEFAIVTATLAGLALEVPTWLELHDVIKELLEGTSDQIAKS